MSDTEGTERREPTKGLRVTPTHQPAGQLYTLHAETLYADGEKDQAETDAKYINWLIETDQKRREHLEKLHAGGQDLLVDMGDMTRASLDIRIDADYEEMTEDIIQTVNHIILQGVPPIKALFSMSQAFAIVLGFALRANMPFEIAKALITQCMNSATQSEKLVRVITRQ